MTAPLALLAAATAMVTGARFPIDKALLKGLPDAAVTLTAHGTTTHCTGPKLSDVLSRLGLPQGEALRGKALRRGIIVHARDDYAVLFSLGELDAGLGGEPAVIATRCEGRTIDAHDGPYRLILPADERPARSVRQVDGIELVG